MRIPGFDDRSPWDVVTLAARKFLNHDMVTYAAALSFHLLLALFPFVIFLLTLLGGLGLSEFFDRILRQARMALPPDGYLLLEQVMSEIRGQPRQGLLSFSIILALWAASAGMRAVMNALNVAYAVPDTRPPWKRFLLSFVYTIGLAILVVATGVLMLIGPQAADWLADRLGVAARVAGLWAWLRWPVIVMLLLLTVALIYYFAPTIDQPFRYIDPRIDQRGARLDSGLLRLLVLRRQLRQLRRHLRQSRRDGGAAALFLRRGGGVALRRRNQRHHPPRPRPRLRRDHLPGVTADVGGRKSGSEVGREPVSREPGL